MHANIVIEIEEVKTVHAEELRAFQQKTAKCMMALLDTLDKSETTSTQHMNNHKLDMHKQVNNKLKEQQDQFLNGMTMLQKHVVGQLRDV